MTELAPTYDTEPALARSGCLATPTAEPARCNFCGHPREPRTLVRLKLHTGAEMRQCVICANNVQAARIALWF